MNINVYDNYFENRGIEESKPYIPRYLSFLEGESRDIEILDIGCGMGSLLMGLKEQGFCNLTGIDVSMKAVMYCKKMQLNCMEMNILEFNGSNEKKYDLVFMNHVLEHLPKSEVIETIKIIKNDVLKGGGKFICSVPNAQSNTEAYWAFEDFTHETMFTSGSLKFVLQNAGFKDIRFLDVNGVEGLSAWKKMIRMPLLKLYKFNRHFWNIITGSMYHGQSIDIFSFDIKACATKEETSGDMSR